MRDDSSQGLLFDSEILQFDLETEKITRAILKVAPLTHCHKRHKKKKYQHHRLTIDRSRRNSYGN